MATSISDQVSSLLSAQVAAPKTRGLPSSNLESAAVIQTIATNLLVYPRTILYVAHLARQGLLALAKEELTQIGMVMQDVANMGNQSFSITDTSSLTDAQTAILQIQDNQKVNIENNSFNRLNSSIQDFLDGQLAPNVKRPGATSLTVPATEAGPALAADYSTLKTTHAQLLAQLYALGVGVQNFTSSPVSTLIGTTAAGRVYADIQDIINSIEADASGAGSSDFANRLIADRATLKVLGSPLNYSDPKVDTQSALPHGYVLQAISAEANAVAEGTVAGPFSSFSPSGTLQVIETVGSGGTETVTGDDTNLLQSINNPAFYGTQVTYPVSIPANTHLFLTLTAQSTLTGWTQAADLTWQQSSVGGGWMRDPSSGLYSQVFRAILNSTGSPVSLSLANIISSIEAATGGYAINGDPSTGTPFTAVEFVQTGTGRLLIYASGTSYQSIGISVSYSAPNTSGGPIGTYVNSAHAILGFTPASGGTNNVVPTQQLVDAMNILFTTAVSASIDPATQEIVLTSSSSSQGTTLAISGTWAATLGLPASAVAESTTITLQGTVLGTETNPVSPQGLMDPGDVIILPSGQTTVSVVGASSITLNSALQTFQLGNVTVKSALYLAWVVLNQNVQDQVQDYLGSKFGASTGPLDAAVAALAGNATPGTINAASNILSTLSTLTQGLITALSDSESLLPTGSAQTEIQSSDGIVQTLTERNYDKALDYYHQCKVAEILTMDYQTASYAGSFMTAAQAVSQNDIDYPNAALDEGTGPSSFQPSRPGTA